ncbi:hypothetical protein IFM89_017104 [Coptis chinensis]|uniref:Anaphase-promoting complex subunit 4-like WD40 domain-containing protein n=1 Tax=Coptis chinensis TaxID=261450 RepID=A0A835HK75_9MAGN|nr:hypothetical protein IFM89_017104 [Coptis chinensis]
MDDAGETSSSVSLHNTKTPLHKTIPRRKLSMENLDRFIPNRSAMDFDYADYVLTTARKGNELKGEGSPRKEAYRKGLAELFNMNRPRILAFKNKPPVFKTLFPKPTSSTSERTLVAPDIGDDYYLNLLDWGSNNVLTIGLGNTVYLWDASNSSMTELFTIDDENGPITSLRWASDGHTLAVGLNNSEVHIWDVISNRRMRTLRGGHSSRVGSLDWNEHILSTGGMDGVITNNDWLHRLDDHTAAVKALAWCPFHSSVLASGGGVGDYHIRFWNTHTSACLNSIDTGSQVCALLWNRNERELLISHGFLRNQLTLWKYPSMVKMAELTGHTFRVLFMTQSPNGCIVASAAGDETLRFWNIFGTPEVVVNPAPKTNLEPFASFSRIR